MGTELYDVMSLETNVGLTKATGLDWTCLISQENRRMTVHWNTFLLKRGKNKWVDQMVFLLLCNLTLTSNRVVKPRGVAYLLCGGNKYLWQNIKNTFQ